MKISVGERRGLYSKRCNLATVHGNPNPHVKLVLLWLKLEQIGENVNKIGQGMSNSQHFFKSGIPHEVIVKLATSCGQLSPYTLYIRFVVSPFFLWLTEVISEIKIWLAEMYSMWRIMKFDHENNWVRRKRNLNILCTKWIDLFTNFMYTILIKVVPDNLKACPRFVRRSNN